MAHKITPKIKAELQEFADRITPPNAGTAQPAKPLTAEDLKARGITADRAGRALQAGQLYYAASLPAVNHHRRLCKAYEAGGWPAVEAYLQPYRTPEKMAKDAGLLPAAPAVAAPADADQLELEQRTSLAYEAGAPCSGQCVTCNCPA